ncbi:MAG: hypothetical protein VKN33_01190 [Candidatus Sericytochromatia bacterium]|nr:hypothetical protein [Candidatus Sericytochromatia bacterium]
MDIHRIAANFLYPPSPPAPAAPFVATMPTYAADRMMAPYVPGAPYQSSINPAAAAQIQAMQAELMVLEAQLASLLALVSPVAVGRPPLPPPPPVPGVPALPPFPPPLPPPPPVTMTAKSGVRATAASPAALPFPGLVAGTRMMLAPGTSVKGFAITGTAAVRSASSSTLDLVAKGAAFFGLFRRTYNLRVEMLKNGKVDVSLNEIDRNGNPKDKVFNGKLEVISQRPGELTLRAPDGKPGSIRQDADGSLLVQHPEGTVRLLFRGVAPLVAGLDDIANDRPLA